MSAPYVVKTGATGAAPAKPRHDWENASPGFCECPGKNRGTADTRVIADVIAGLRARGCVFHVEGEQFRCRCPSGVLTDDVRAFLREHKQEVLKLLLGEVLTWEEGGCLFVEATERLANACRHHGVRFLSVLAWAERERPRMVAHMDNTERRMNAALLVGDGAAFRRHLHEWETMQARLIEQYAVRLQQKKQPHGLGKN